MQLLSARVSAGIALAATLASVAHAQVGSVIGQFATPPGVRVSGLGTDPAGNIWLAGTGGEIYQLSSTGVPQNNWVASNSGVPFGVTSDGSFVYVTDGNPNTGGPDVDVYNMAGTYAYSFPLTGVRSPAGIVWRPGNNNLYVVDRLQNTVSEWDRQGASIGSYAAPGAQDDGIGYDPVLDQFWIYQALGDSCDNYDSAFTLLNQFAGATTATGQRGGPATFLNGIFYVGVRDLNTIVLFDTVGNTAGFETYGTACPQPGCFYEQFTGTGTGDLTGGGIQFRYSNSSYRAVPGGTFNSNLGTNLNLADDGIARNQALGFTFPFPGGTQAGTTAIDVAANGWVGLIPNEVVDTGFYVGASGAEMIRFARIATWWDDLDPAAAGSVRFNQLSNPARAVVTWNAVPQFGLTDSNTIQLTLFPNGDFNIYWQAGCADDAIVGFSSGNGVPDPGSTDLSAASFNTFGPYGAPLTLSSNRPVVGQTLMFQVSNVPANATFAGLIMGQTRIATPLDFLGATGCTLLSDGIVGSFTFAPNPGQLSIPIANNPSFLGAILTNQALIIAPGVNPLGAIASNGLELRLGN